MQAPARTRNPASFRALPTARDARNGSSRATRLAQDAGAVDHARARGVERVPQGVAKREPAGGDLVEDLRPGHEPGLEAARANPPDHLAVPAAEERGPLAVQVRVEPAEALEHPPREGEIGAHRRLPGRQGARVLSEPEGPVGTLEPFGYPVGEDRDNLSADDADRRGRLPGERADELGEPVGLHEDVVVDKGDHLPGGLADRPVPAVVEAGLLLQDPARRRGRRKEGGDDVPGVVRRVVVDHQELPAARRIVLAHEAGQGLAEEPGAVEGDDGDCDPERGHQWFGIAAYDFKLITNELQKTKP